MESSEFDKNLGEIINIIVSYDTGWSKRGNGRSYDSLNGYSTIIGNSRVNNFDVDKSGHILFTGNGQTYLYIENLIIHPGHTVGFMGWKPERDEKIFVRNIIGDDINNLRSVYFAHSNFPRKAQAIYQGNGYYQILPSYDNTRWEPPPPVPEPTTYGAVLAGVGVVLWLSQHKRRGKGRRVLLAGEESKG